MIDDWQICNGNIDIIKIEKVSLGKNSKIKLKERIKVASKKNRLKKKMIAIVIVLVMIIAREIKSLG